jgi:hypothetical protein
MSYFTRMITTLQDRIQKDEYGERGSDGKFVSSGGARADSTHSGKGAHDEVIASLAVFNPKTGQHEEHPLTANSYEDTPAKALRMVSERLATELAWGSATKTVDRAFRDAKSWFGSKKDRPLVHAVTLDQAREAYKKRFGQTPEDTYAGYQRDREVLARRGPTVIK